MPVIAKITGADCELGNSEDGNVNANIAASLIGCFGVRIGVDETKEIDHNDMGMFASHRTWVPYNGSCAYVDMGHMEICLPETRSAESHVLYQEGFLRYVGRMARDMNKFREKSGKPRVNVWAGNSDGFGSAWGTHLNVSVDSDTYLDVTCRDLNAMGTCASAIAALSVFLGSGKAGSDKTDSRIFQLSQRAEFIETLFGPQTTYNRPIVNTRDEAHAQEGISRLHIIPFDITRLHMTTYLKVGMMQLLLACLETGENMPGLVISRPLEAMREWNSVKGSRRKLRTSAGNLNLVWYLRNLCHTLSRITSTNREIRVAVPGAESILREMTSVLLDFERGGVGAISDRIQWAAKYELLASSGAKAQDRARILVRAFEDINSDESIYEQMNSDGMYSTIFDNDTIDMAWRKPPEGTRAKTRSELLSSLSGVSSIDWASVRFREKRSRDEIVVMLDEPGVYDDMASPGSDVTLDKLLRDGKAEIRKYEAIGYGSRGWKHGASSFYCG